MRGASANQHLSTEEIEQLTGLAADVAGGALEGAMRHLDGCEQCRLRLLISWGGDDAGDQAGGGLPPQSQSGSSACPGEERWLDLAAGAMPHAERLRHLEHAAACAKCGPLLQTAMQDVGMELTPEEEAKVASLSSANSAWQESLAARIAGSPAPKSETKSEAPRRAFTFWPRWALASAAAAFAAAGAWWGWVLLRTPSVDALLAQAYTERRTIEVRIPGAKYAPMKVERGASRSNLRKAPALLKAEALISENLAKSPDDTAWLQAKARADLLDGNYEPAVQTLLQALEAQPDSVGLLTDLGSAYLLRGESAGHAADYGNAAESLSKALAKSPNDPVVLFNHALACEKLFFYTKAIEDWQRYLSLDPSGGWANEARANLERVKAERAEREKRAGTPLLPPQEFVALLNTNHEEAAAVLDQQVERYLEIGSQAWLPQVYGSGSSSQGSSAEARRALERLAEVLKNRHDDRWLVDFLQHSPDSIQADAVHLLVASDEALQNGRYGRAIELAQRSASDFWRSGNQPGALRASFSVMLSQTFALKSKDCLSTAEVAIPKVLATTYRWLQIQMLMQQGQCQYATPGIDAALRSTLQSIELARLFHYPGLELRATAFAAAYRRETGNADRGLQDLIKGLATFWQTGGTSTRGQNLYSVLFKLAASKNWNHVQALALSEKIFNFPVKDPLDQTASWQLLAGAEERAGDYQSAKAALQLASERLAVLPEDSGIISRKAEIKLEDALVQLHLGDPNAALVTLTGLRQWFETLDPLFQAQYFKTYGEGYLALGLESSAQPLFERALSIVETALMGLRTENERLEWSRTQGEIYRGLLEVKLKSATPAEALALWEWYKGASLRTPVRTESARDEIKGPLSIPDVSSYELPPTTALVSYVSLENFNCSFRGSRWRGARPCAAAPWQSRTTSPPFFKPLRRFVQQP